jgi:phage baseplate assembly protein W
MATGISPKLPLNVDPVDGCYGLNKTLIQSVQQNFKNLVLTIPGERIMDPLFGVGLKSYLFENNGNDTYVLISEKIREQAGKYLPFIDVIDINFNGPEGDEFNNDPQFVHISIKYKILPLDADVILNITQEVE